MVCVTGSGIWGVCYRKWCVCNRKGYVVWVCVTESDVCALQEVTCVVFVAGSEVWGVCVCV